MPVLAGRLVFYDFNLEPFNFFRYSGQHCRFKEPYLSSDYILLVKSSSQFKSTAEWLLKYLKLSVKTKLFTDSFSIQKPLPYLVVFDESTIVRFLKEAQFHTCRYSWKNEKKTFNF